MISYETLDACLVLMGIMFAAAVGCEWLKDDMRYLYQGVLFAIIAAMGLVFGFELFSGNIWYGGLGGMKFEPLGAVLIAWGALSAICGAVVWLPKIASPFKPKTIYRLPDAEPKQPMQPKKPLRPGGF